METMYPQRLAANIIRYMLQRYMSEFKTFLFCQVYRTIEKNNLVGLAPRTIIRTNLANMLDFNPFVFD